MWLFPFVSDSAVCSCSSFLCVCAKVLRHHPVRKKKTTFVHRAPRPHGDPQAAATGMRGAHCNRAREGNGGPAEVALDGTGRIRQIKERQAIKWGRIKRIKRMKGGGREGEGGHEMSGYRRLAKKSRHYEGCRPAPLDPLRPSPLDPNLIRQVHPCPLPAPPTPPPPELPQPPLPPLW